GRYNCDFALSLSKGGRGLQTCFDRLSTGLEGWQAKVALSVSPDRCFGSMGISYQRQSGMRAATRILTSHGHVLLTSSRSQDPRRRNGASLCRCQTFLGTGLHVPRETANCAFVLLGRTPRGPYAGPSQKGRTSHDLL